MSEGKYNPFIQNCKLEKTKLKMKMKERMKNLEHKYYRSKFIEDKGLCVVSFFSLSKLFLFIGENEQFVFFFKEL